MDDLLLILYTRKGCCLCEGLEQRLLNISLKSLTPPLELHLVDIDHIDTSVQERMRYDLKVPVLAIKSTVGNLFLELPQVSPRLDSDGLTRWLKEIIQTKIASN